MRTAPSTNRAPGSCGGTAASGARALAYLYLGGAVAAYVATLQPFSPQTPVPLLRGLSAVCLGAGSLLYLRGDHLGRATRHALLGLLAVLVAAGVGASASFGGAMVSGYAAFWAAIYGAHFLPRRQALAHAGVLSLGFALALHVRGYPVVVPWVIVAGSVLAATALLGRLVEQINQQATTDQLTGVLNRHGLRDLAAHEFAIARRTGRPVTVAVLDLDDFKVVNDRGGHAAGDRALRQLADSWREHLRAGDVLARTGGDEFVLLLPRTTPHEAAALLERLAAVSDVAWSSGLARWHPGEDLDSCVARADRALYRTKGGRAPWRADPTLFTIR